MVLFNIDLAELQEKYDAQVTKLTSQHQEEIQKLEVKHKLEKTQATRELEIVSFLNYNTS